MEAVSDDRLYLRPIFFVMAGCNNDVTAFNAFIISGKISAGTYPRPVVYEVGTEKRNKPYLLCDGIYPKAPLFLHSVANPTIDDESFFVPRQERL